MKQMKGGLGEILSKSEYRMNQTQQSQVKNCYLVASFKLGSQEQDSGQETPEPGGVSTGWTEAITPGLGQQ